MSSFWTCIDMNGVALACRFAVTKSLVHARSDVSGSDIVLDLCAVKHHLSYITRRRVRAVPQPRARESAAQG